MHEATKSMLRRMYDARFMKRYFIGNGIDIGCGDDSISKFMNHFPLIESVTDWDIVDGDAQYMQSVPDNTYDFVHSSHCLEHLNDPFVALSNWIRICKEDGYIIITIPDQDLYEQGAWPSTNNGDHKTAWTIVKNKTWCPNTVTVFELINQNISNIEVLKIELIDNSYDYSLPRTDQTLGISESAIEIILRKRTTIELNQGGRLPNT